MTHRLFLLARSFPQLLRRCSKCRKEDEKEKKFQQEIKKKDFFKDGNRKFITELESENSFVSFEICTVLRDLFWLSLFVLFA